MAGTFDRLIERRAGWGVITGIFTAIAGLVMVLYPAGTATVTALFIGSALILSAVAELVFAFAAASGGTFFLNMLLAVLYGAGGLALVSRPSEGVGALTAALATLLLIQAGIEFAVAYQLRSTDALWWFFGDGLLSTALSLLILFRWPSGSEWAIGTLLGLGVMTAGISRAVAAGSVFGAAKGVESWNEH